jgi:hypothetical protein
MRKHSIELVAAVKADRVAGAAIPVLMAKYSLPKTTIWHYVKGIELNSELKTKIRSQQGGSALRSKHSWSAAESKAQKLLFNFDEEVVWPVLLAALYWSEGTKQGGFTFTNTDERMIRVFLKILRTKLGVKNNDLTILIRTCSPMNQDSCRKHWSKVTGVTMNKIRINHDDKQNKSKTEYGMCRVTVKKGGQYLKLVHCLTRGLAATMLDVQ